MSPSVISKSTPEGQGLCEAVGLDPAAVTAVVWYADQPKTAFFIVQDGPLPDDRHVEEHPVPEGWLS